MDQARSTISKIFNGDPHSQYTRFLAHNMEGDNSHVEMKGSADVDEEAGGNGAVENMNHNSNLKHYVVHKNGRTPKNLIFLVATTLLIFIIGYLIAYLIHGKKEAPPDCPAPVSFEKRQPIAAPLMDWNDVKDLLSRSLSTNSIEATMSDYSRSDHRAGSDGNDALGNKVSNRFKKYGMTTWTDEHFIKVQDPPKSGFNTIVLHGGELEKSTGFLSYSATGSRTGGILYVNYGQESDFRLLRDRTLNMSGRVMLVRAGKITLAEKVANAANMNASAVLIYMDQSDYPIDDNTQFYGHVHYGSGDPYTPGFPSFNHTQFPPIQSSGLPNILAQTITQRVAMKILNSLTGPSLPQEWGGYHKLGEESNVVTVEVNNVLAEKKVHNVFGVIKGNVDSDRYVIIGAQRDAWGPGFAASTVGTSVLVELARSISEMKRSGFTPRRSIVFASWSAGEYGSVGATEWLEAYLSSLNMKAFSYINLDGIVTGNTAFKVSGSPLMYTLIEKTLKDVKMTHTELSLMSVFGKGNWEANILEPLSMDNTAYPFLAFSGIPSVSFRFTRDASDYPYFGTLKDTQDRLNAVLANQTPQLVRTAARFAGHMALRLVHDQLLPLDLQNYNKVIKRSVSQIYLKVMAIQKLPQKILPKSLTGQWLSSASGAYGRAARALAQDVLNSDLEDVEMCRIINDRVMAVERNFLTPFTSTRDTPFRHILLGSGPHTLKGLINHLDALRMDNPGADTDLFQNQFALATWTIQGCANALEGNIWSLYED